MNFVCFLFCRVCRCWARVKSVEVSGCSHVKFVTGRKSLFTGITLRQSSSLWSACIATPLASSAVTSAILQILKVSGWVGSLWKEIPSIFTIHLHLKYMHVSLTLKFINWISVRHGAPFETNVHHHHQQDQDEMKMKWSEKMNEQIIQWIINADWIYFEFCTLKI